MKRISLEKALGVVERLGLYVRDAGLLESALARPTTSVFGRPAYPSLPLAAAAQTESLARNHALVDGDKRTAFMMLNVLLAVSNARLEADDDAVFTYILDVAQGELSLQESAEFIASHLRPWGWSGSAASSAAP